MGVAKKKEKKEKHIKSKKQATGAENNKNASSKSIIVRKKDELFKLDMPFKEALDGFLKVNKNKNE